MAGNTPDLRPGSFWIVGNTPYPINMRVGSTWVDNEYIRPGEYLLVLECDRDYQRTKVITTRGVVGFIDTGWWIPNKHGNFYLTEIGT